MASRKSARHRPNRKYGRNLIGLLSKAYKYGELHGVELALYIEYKEKEGFVSYETDGYSCHTSIDEKVRSPSSGVRTGLTLPRQKKLPGAKNYGPARVEKEFRFGRAKTEAEPVAKEPKKDIDLQPDPNMRRSIAQVTFPEFPVLNLFLDFQI
jgi:hypothetical protein